MNVSIFHDMASKLPLPGLLEGVANLIRTDEKLAVFTRSYRQTGSKTFKKESQLFAVASLFEGGKGRSNISPREHPFAYEGIPAPPPDGCRA